jgi:hypothetical protein
MGTPTKLKGNAKGNKKEVATLIKGKEVEDVGCNEG